MLSHVTIGSNDVSSALTFYDQILLPLGLTCLIRGEDHGGYGKEASGLPFFWVVQPFDGKAAIAGNGPHVALLAPNRVAVDAFYAAALEKGARDEGPPGLRPHYHSNYYGAYIRDLDGNKIQAVCHSADA